jgi:hypothetical protein
MIRTVQGENKCELRNGKPAAASFDTVAELSLP